MLIVLSILLFAGVIINSHGQNFNEPGIEEKFQNNIGVLDESPKINLLSKRTKLYGKKSYMREKNEQVTKKLKREISNFHTNRQENESEDYYAQRKAVMDRYYARKKQISEKFRDKISTSEIKNEYLNPLNNNSIEVTTPKTVEDNFFLNNTIIPDITASSVRGQDNNNFTSSTVEKSDDSPDISRENERNNGYYKIGERTFRENERLVYQHNLGIGFKVKSELDAAFEVILNKTISITCVELIPYSVNSTASMVLLKGGVKHHFVKIKLQPHQDNHGLSYIIKVWGEDNASSK